MQAALIGSLLLVVVTWVVMATGVGSAPSMRSPRNLADVDALAGRVVASRNDPLLRLRVEWLADDRPAYETIDAFEADVERVLRGEWPILARPRGLPPRSDRTVAATPRLAKQYDVPLARMAILDGDDDSFPF